MTGDLVILTPPSVGGESCLGILRPPTGGLRMTLRNSSWQIIVWKLGEEMSSLTTNYQSPTTGSPQSVRPFNTAIEFLGYNL